ncbi:pentapeptide repeat-containing protein [Jiella sp. M17.18]|uniref:pentapeptide repeat-containing protein n=1 Tax=Jiella sp. M17.18 TaxID=3234247 RepID=UPI0034DEEA2F
MTRGLLEFDLPAAVIKDLEAKIRTKKTSFGELVAVFDLDPKRDFRHADLRQIDFSNTDIRGFDFHGADLRGAMGSNVRWDDTTLLDGAEVSGSLFAHRIRQQELLNANDAVKAMFNRLRSEHWSRSIDWVAHNLKPSSKTRDQAVTVAAALFADADDQFLKSSLLFFISRGFDRRGDYRDFLIDTFNHSYEDKKMRRAVISAMRDFFSASPAVFEILKSEIARTSGEDQRQVLVAVGRSPLAGRDRDEVMYLVRRHAEPSNRRAYVGAVAGRIGSEYAFVMRDPWSRIPYDIEETVLELDVRRLASEWLRHSSTFSTEDLAWANSLSGERHVFDRILSIYDEMRTQGFTVTVEPLENLSWIT